MINEINIDDLKLPKNATIHFVGIGGSSMSGIAMIMAARGHRVSGSDAEDSPVIEKLRASGIVVFIGHNEANIPHSCDLVVYTVAVGDSNPEVLRAASLGIPVIERGKFLGYLTAEHKYSVAISGTHGKTTTTAMVSTILIDSDYNPAVHIGGQLGLIGGNYRVSGSDFFVTEACEYHSNFLNLRPYCGTILNVDREHLDWFKTYENVEAAFTKFAGIISPEGFLVVCADWPDAVKCAKEGASSKIVTYSVRKPSEIPDKCKSDEHYYADNIVLAASGSTFDVYKNDSFIMSCKLNIAGIHNVSNALAASCTAFGLGCTPEQVSSALELFVGADRRFQIVGTCNGAPVIDDYAHHPTEIKATLASARLTSNGTIWGVFQPHTFTRAINCLEDFGKVFKNCDKVIVTDIYASREKDNGEINSRLISDYFTECGIDSTYMKDFTQIAIYLKKNVKEGDLVITLGAGDVNKIARMISVM